MTHIRKLATGIPGFDSISNGGLPLGRSTLVSGTAGSAKTVFACQFLVEGIRQFDSGGVFVTFEEPPADIRQNLRGFDWPIDDWESESRWAFVDASPDPQETTVIGGPFDFGALIARIEHAVVRTGASRVALDSIAAVFASYSSASDVRNELRRVIDALKLMGVTSVVTAERASEYGHIAKWGVEEFVADNVVLLRNVLEAEKRRRTIEILKFRGTDHAKGEYPFTVLAGSGLVVIPLSAIELQQGSTETRASSGVPELDEMCGGGLFRDSVVLLSGPTGTGKTLLASSFLAGGAKHGERALLFAFEESPQQIFRNARGWGIDFERYEAEKLLEVTCVYPESRSLEDHLIAMKEVIDDFKPQRIAVDSLSALERVASERGYREFVLGITSFVKSQSMMALFTSTTPTLLGGTSATESHISTTTDSIILLRYVELYGEMRRGITVLKMRGSMHDKGIREYRIDGSGMHITDTFRNISGILSGHIVLHADDEIERAKHLFEP